MTLGVCRDCSDLADSLGDDTLRAADARTDVCRACGSRRLVAHEELDTLDIAHIDCDAFYASVEKRDDPSLRDKPLIVGHPGGRGVVTTACYIARRYGIRSAMPMFKALQLLSARCRHPAEHGEIQSRQPADPRDFRGHVGLHRAGLARRGLSRPDAGSSPDRSDLPSQSLADAQRRIEREIGITVSLGLSYNKFLAKLASDLMKPRGYSVIGRAEARDFLAGLPVGKIHGVGAATAERMAAHGFELISDLQGLAERDLTARFGKFGDRLFQFVNGIDDPPRDAGPADQERVGREYLSRRHRAL